MHLPLALQPVFPVLRVPTARARRAQLFVLPPSQFLVLLAPYLKGMSVCAPLVLPVLSSQRLEQLPANPAQPVPLVLLMVLQTVFLVNLAPILILSAPSSVLPVELAT